MVTFNILLKYHMAKCCRCQYKKTTVFVFKDIAAGKRGLEPVAFTMEGYWDREKF
jgi:hypothetical protein